MLRYSYGYAAQIFKTPSYRYIILTYPRQLPIGLIGVYLLLPYIDLLPSVFSLIKTQLFTRIYQTSKPRSKRTENLDGDFLLLSVLMFSRLEMQIFTNI